MLENCKKNVDKIVFQEINSHPYVRRNSPNVPKKKYSQAAYDDGSRNEDVNLEMTWRRGDKACWY